MFKKLKLFAIAIGCVAALGVNTANAADLKLGALYLLSDGLALLGDESFRGMQIAVNERNAAGGVNGSRVVLVKADAVDANQHVGESTSLAGAPAASNDAVIGVTPLRRLGKLAEVADACLFLTSRQADFITGQVIDVAGGWLMT
ncbi:Periplasmic binding protein [Polaromonas sp. OV174]|nr:Periplasmic binding protein [Polaromonas sp. OV174]